eukprot:SAG11_NODE_3586_length_2351_cov_2.305506_1_plen_158_part_00
MRVIFQCSGTTGLLTRPAPTTARSSGRRASTTSTASICSYTASAPQPTTCGATGVRKCGPTASLRQRWRFLHLAAAVAAAASVRLRSCSAILAISPLIKTGKLVSLRQESLTRRRLRLRVSRRRLRRSFWGYILQSGGQATSWSMSIHQECCRTRRR